MKRFYYNFLQAYKFDLLTFVSAAILLYTNFQNISDPFRLLLWSILITFLSLAIIIFLRYRDKDFYFLSFSQNKDKNDWIGQGVFDYNRIHDSFSITDSNDGFVYSKTFQWSDYEMEFEFKLIKTCLGVIVRAINLSDYAMIQIVQEGIRPHIKINGGWKFWEPEEVEMKFEKKLSLDKWYKCKLFIDKERIRVKLSINDQTLFDRDWIIPIGSTIGFPFKKSDKDKNPLFIPFPINLAYGSMGFRNAPGEKALIKNLLIKKI